VLQCVCQVLRDKVATERFEFGHFVKHQCALSQDRYLLINPDARRFIEEVWQVSTQAVHARKRHVEISCHLHNVNKYSFIKHTPAIATESFIDVFFTISLTTCFGPLRAILR
jgi:hypothetical protein